MKSFKEHIIEGLKDQAIVESKSGSIFDRLKSIISGKDTKKEDKSAISSFCGLFGNLFKPSKMAQARKAMIKQNREDLKKVKKEKKEALEELKIAQMKARNSVTQNTMLAKYHNEIKKIQAQQAEFGKIETKWKAIGAGTDVPQASSIERTLKHVKEMTAAFTPGEVSQIEQMSDLATKIMFKKVDGKVVPCTPEERQANIDKFKQDKRYADVMKNCELVADGTTNELKAKGDGPFAQALNEAAKEVVEYEVQNELLDERASQKEDEIQAITDKQEAVDDYNKKKEQYNNELKDYVESLVNSGKLSNDGTIDNPQDLGLSDKQQAAIKKCFDSLPDTEKQKLGKPVNKDGLAQFVNGLNLSDKPDDEARIKAVRDALKNEYKDAVKDLSDDDIKAIANKENLDELAKKISEKQKSSIPNFPTPPSTENVKEFVDENGEWKDDKGNKGSYDQLKNDLKNQLEKSKQDAADIEEKIKSRDELTEKLTQRYEQAEQNNTAAMAHLLKVEYTDESGKKRNGSVDDLISSIQLNAGETAEMVDGKLKVGLKMPDGSFIEKPDVADREAMEKYVNQRKVAMLLHDKDYQDDAKTFTKMTIEQDDQGNVKVTDENGNSVSPLDYAIAKAKAQNAARSQKEAESLKKELTNAIKTRRDGEEDNLSKDPLINAIATNNEDKLTNELGSEANGKAIKDALTNSDLYQKAKDEDDWNDDDEKNVDIADDDKEDDEDDEEYDSDEDEVNANGEKTGNKVKKKLKNPKKEWRRKKNKATGKTTQRYYQVKDGHFVPDGASISKKEYIQKVQAYQKAREKVKEESSILGFRDYLKIVLS